MLTIDEQLTCLDDGYDVGVKKLATFLSAKKIIGVGESTHGTAQFCRFKAALSAELVKNHGFSVFALEDSPAACEGIDNFINKDIGDIRQLLRELYKVWQTKEMRELILAIKSLGSNKVKFIGIDIDQRSKGNLGQRDKLMAERVSAAAQQGKVFIWIHNEHVRTSGKSSQSIMGRFLKQKHASDYFSIGQFFGSGTFSAKALEHDNLNTKDRTLSTIEAPLPDDRFIERLLHKANCPNFYLMLNKKNKVDALSRSYLAKSLGWGLVPDKFIENMSEINPYEDYDCLVYFDKTSHTTPI